MKTILIPVRTDRLITNEDIQYAIVNREYPKTYQVSEIKSPYSKVKIKESVGLWNMLTGFLP